MKTNIGFIRKSDVVPYSKDSDVCSICRAQGLNMCDVDEICQIRLAKALGRKHAEILAPLDYAERQGLISVRDVEASGLKPRKLIRMTEEGKTFFCSHAVICQK